MHDRKTRNAQQLQDGYLQAVRRLTSEIVCSIAAIARNDAAAFSEHVQNQLALCALIQTMERDLRQPRPAPVAPELVAALRELHRAKRTYALAVSKSSRSLKMFLALYASAKESQPGASEPGENRRALSCEI